MLTKHYQSTSLLVQHAPRYLKVKYFCRSYNPPPIKGDLCLLRSNVSAGFDQCRSYSDRRPDVGKAGEERRSRKKGSPPQWVSPIRLDFQQISIRKIARMYGISNMSLQRRIKGLSSKYIDCEQRQRLNRREEIALID